MTISKKTFFSVLSIEVKAATIIHSLFISHITCLYRCNEYKNIYT